MGKKLISFSLWGNEKVYTRGAIQNVIEAKEVYPDWIVRIYIAKNCPVIGELKEMDCELVIMSREPQWIPLFWRFNAASDKNADYIIFRDCDSRVNTKEAAAVAEWIRSGKAAHLMKDWPPPHATETILAGMWGLRGGFIKNMPELARKWISIHDMGNKYTDQDFLRYKIWPLIKHSVLNHGVDSPAGPGRPWPEHEPMKYGDYVGQPITP